MYIKVNPEPLDQTFIECYGFRDDIHKNTLDV